MATTITVGGTAIDYRDFSIDVPVSSVGIAPEASIVAKATASIGAGDSVTIDIDGTAAFEGTTTSGGTKSELGGLRVDCEHAAVEMFGELVDLSLSSTTAENVLQSAVSATSNGSNFTVTVNATGASVPSYDVSNRAVKQVFRDMCDRNGWVWWVDPAGTTITVDAVGGGGLWQSLDTAADKVSVQQFDSGDVETVRNTVTVVGTGADAVSATATDATSVSNYGVRTGESPYNVQYIKTQSEAQAFADALLVADPLAEGKLLVGQNVGDVVSPLVNQTVDVTDDAKDISATGLAIEKQTIEQGRATLQVGEGAGTSISEINRRARNRDDLTNPGTGVGDDSVGTDQLVDLSVIESKLADAAVAVAKLQDNAVVQGKLADLSVSETKIQDDSISTPKLQAEAVTANEIAADTITAAEILAGTITATEIAFGTITGDRIAADTIQATEIASGTITANEIDTLDLDTGELSITDPGTGEGVEIVPNVQGRVDIVPINQGDLVDLGFGDNFNSVNADRVRPREELAVGVPPAASGSGGVASFEPDAGSTAFLLSAPGGQTTFYPLDDDFGSIGQDGNAFFEMWSYNYFDAATDSAINDGGDPLEGLAEGRGPPDHAAVRDDDGEVRGYNLSDMARSVWDVVRAQQRRIDDLESRLEVLDGDNA